MIKRPLCLIAVLILGIQAFRVGGGQKVKDLNPSPIEKTAVSGETVTVEGTVYRREERSEYQMYYLTENQICLKQQIIYESKILVYIKQYENQTSNLIEIGNKVRLTGKVQFFEPAANPGNFDQKFYYQKQGIHAAVWCESAEVMDSKIWKVREGLAKIRIHWKHMLVSTQGEYYGNCMSAILLGDKSDLDESVKELYQKSGIGHVLAISGLHMSFLGMGFYRILRKMGCSFGIAGSFGSLILLLYTSMIGGGISAQRAWCMFVVRVGADITGRDYDLPTSLAVAAVVITARQPLYLFDAGFLLSFGALAGIAFVYPVFEKLDILPLVVRAGASIQLVLLPILLYYYFELPVYSIILNLLVVPLMSIVMGAGIFGSLLSVFFQTGGKMVLLISKMILWGYEKSAEISVAIPFDRVVTGQPRIWWCVLYYVILFGGCIGMLYHQKEQKKEKTIRQQLRRGSYCIGLIWMFCIGCIYSYRKPGELRITLIDVGQGDSIYVKSPSGKRFLIDGGSTSESQVGKYRIIPFLKSQGAAKLDYVFVSHGDADHINGIEELLEYQKLGIRIECLVFPTESVMDEPLWKLAELAQKERTQVVKIECGQQISDGEMAVKCLAPSGEYKGETGNASSMVLELEYGEFQMLFTGDLEGEGEQQLIESGLLEDYDVLKAGHHGSKNSSSEKMLELVQPEFTMISAGKENRYGHPHQEVLERLGKVGSRIYCTKDTGAITIVTNGRRIKVIC